MLNNNELELNEEINNIRGVFLLINNFFTKIPTVHITCI